MKPFLTIFFLVTISFSLSGQSNLLKIGGTYRNTNYLSHTGNQKVGIQLGYNYQISEKMTMGVNLGDVSNHWDIENSDFFVLKEKERTIYMEAIVLFPILYRWIPSGNLKLGIGYVGSRNSFQYPEMAVIRNNELESNTIRSSVHYLHELGLMLEYNYAISNHFVVYASTGFSASLNRVPGYQSTITEYFSSGGTGRSTSSLENRNKAHYRVSIGVGYLF